VQFLSLQPTICIIATFLFERSHPTSQRTGRERERERERAPESSTVAVGAIKKKEEEEKPV